MTDRYMGNPLLKAVGVTSEWTEEELQEYVKCSKNPVYFIENYMKIVNVDKGLVPLKMYNFQKKMVKTFHKNRFSIAKLPRQSGKTTMVISYFLWYILFNQDVNIAILANKGSLAREILGRLQLAYENLPIFLQQGVKIWNRGDIHLENGSKIVAASTSSSAVRGGTYNIIMLDEFAFVPKHIADEFFSSVYPTISSGKSTKVIIVSTPHGMNHFYKMWTDAVEKRSHYVPIEVAWNEVPGRDLKWKLETISNTSEEQFAQEFECDFIGSVNTLIAANKLKAMPFKVPLSSQNFLDIYEMPEPGRSYVIIVDVSHGEGMDYSAFSVIDASEVPYKQVAKYKNSKISPLMYPTVIHNVAKKYNEAFVFIEINDIGQQVADIIHHDFEYENLLKVSVKGRAGQMLTGGFSVQSQYGIKTTKKVKQIGCSNLKTLIEEDKLLIYDFDTISELTSFIAQGQSYQAEAGCFDDLAMTLVLFAWLTTQQYFKDTTNLDVRRMMYDEKMKLMEDEILPFGFIDDGVDDASDWTDEDGTSWSVVDPIFRV